MAKKIKNIYNPQIDFFVHVAMVISTICFFSFETMLGVYNNK